MIATLTLTTTTTTPQHALISLLPSLFLQSTVHPSLALTSHTPHPTML